MKVAALTDVTKSTLVVRYSTYDFFTSSHFRDTKLIAAVGSYNHITFQNVCNRRRKQSNHKTILRVLVQAY